MDETPDDLAMRARMAEQDATELREALIEAVFRGATRPSNKTLIAFAVERIEHSRRIAPDNPDGLPLPPGTSIPPLAAVPASDRGLAAWLDEQIGDVRLNLARLAQADRPTTGDFFAIDQALERITDDVRERLADGGEGEEVIEGRDETCPTCQAIVGTSLAYVLDEHTWSIEDGPGSENPPLTCGASEVAVHYVLAGTFPSTPDCPWHGSTCDGTDHEDHDPAMPLGDRLAATPAGPGAAAGDRAALVPSIEAALFAPLTETRVATLDDRLRPLVHTLLNEWATAPASSTVDGRGETESGER